VPLDRSADFGTGITVRVVSIEAVKGVATRPGDIAGPALRVKLKAANSSRKRVSLAHTVVDVSYGRKRTPGVGLSRPGVKPFPDAVAPGQAVEGTYVVAVPVEERDRIQVFMSYSASEPTVVFEGSAV